MILKRLFPCDIINMNVPTTEFSLTETESRMFALLEGLGIKAYAVGGFVRDAVMGRPRHDLDIAVSTAPSETRRLLEPYAKVIDTGLSFGTVTAVLDGVPFELTTFRADIGINDGRHPSSVEYVTDIEKDLSRRDFTVNAMAWSPKSGLLDIFDGAGDIKRRVISCVGDPYLRFEEDALRILRALRFASVLGFDIQKQTSDAIFEMAHRLSGISAERIFAEMSKLLVGGAGRIISKYSEIFSSVIPCFTSERAGVLDSLPPDLSLRFALLFDSADGVAAGMASLKPPTSLLKRVTALCRILPLPETETALAALHIDCGEELIDQAALLSENRKAAEIMADLKKSGRLVTAKSLAISPLRLTELGVPFGPAVGKTVKALCMAVASGECTNDQAALEKYYTESLSASHRSFQ